MRQVPQQLIFFKEIIHSIHNRFNCALIAHTWQFFLQHFFFPPEALSKHRMGLTPGIVYGSSPEINRMGFAEPALDIVKVCICWGSCLFYVCHCYCQGKGWCEQAKNSCSSLLQKQLSWPLALPQAGAQRLLLHPNAAPSPGSTHLWGGEILHFLYLWACSGSCVVLDSTF